MRYDLNAMPDSGTDLAQLAQQLKDERMLVSGYIASTVPFMVFSAITLAAITVSIASCWVWFDAPDASPDVSLVIALLVLALMVVAWAGLYLSRYLLWRSHHQQMQRILASPAYAGLLDDEQLLVYLFNALRTTAAGLRYLRPWPQTSQEFVETRAAFLLLLPQAASLDSFGLRHAATQVQADWLATQTAEEVLSLKRRADAIPGWSYHVRLAYMRTKLQSDLAFLMACPLLLRGGAPYMRRNAAACAIVERLLEEQVKPQ